MRRRKPVKQAVSPAAALFSGKLVRLFGLTGKWKPVAAEMRKTGK